MDFLCLFVVVFLPFFFAGGGGGGGVISFFRKMFQEYHQRVKQLVSRSGPMLSGFKLFAKYTNIRIHHYLVESRRL